MHNTLVLDGLGGEGQGLATGERANRVRCEARRLVDGCPASELVTLTYALILNKAEVEQG